MTELVDLPGRRRGFDWFALAAEVRQNPGKWHRVPTAPTNGAGAQINGGLLVAFRPVGDYQAAVRDHVLYVKYEPQTDDTVE